MHLGDVAAKGYALLRSWEDLAPLDAEQIAAVETLASHCRVRDLPDHLRDAPSEMASPEAREEGVLQSSQAFLQWNAKLEALRVTEAEERVDAYVQALESQMSICQEASALVHNTLAALNQTLKLYKDAVGRSKRI